MHSQEVTFIANISYKSWYSQLSCLTFSIKEWYEGKPASSLVVSLDKTRNEIASTFERLGW